MTTKHYALIAACFASVGAMISAFTDWNEALRPPFIGGVVGVIATQITTIFTAKP